MQLFFNSVIESLLLGIFLYAAVLGLTLVVGWVVYVIKAKL